jgi:glycosyltransferase involved in cell wall biosynthesis
LRNQIYKLFFVDLSALYPILGVVDNFKPEVLFVRDFPLVGTALIVRKIRQVKVIYDVNDLVSYRMMSDLRVPQQGRLVQLRKKLNSPFAGIDRIRRLESHYFRTVDRIIIPNDHYKEKMLAMGVPGEKLVVLPNYEDLEWHETKSRAPAVLRKYKDQFIISYVGAFYPRRGVDVLIRAMPMVLDTIPEAKLVLVGPVRDIEANLKLSLENLAREMGLSDYIEFTGTVPTELVLSYVDATDIGVIPFRDTIHTNNAVGHKVFMYMAAAKPLIVTNLHGQAEVVHKVGCGLVVPTGDPQHLAEAIVKLYHDPQLRDILGEKGKTAVQQSYNWEVGSQQFVGMIKELAREVEGTA